jgi:hypothetical protein
VFDISVNVVVLSDAWFIGSLNVALIDWSSATPA